MKSQRWAKLKAMMFSNIPLKILAVIISAVAWIVITNISDPARKITIDNIAVIVKNEATLDKKGYIYENKYGQISIEIKGPKSIVESLSEDDFEAYADFEEWDGKSKYVDIHVKCNDKDASKHIKIISTKNTEKHITVSKKVNKEIPIEIVFNGSLDSGYVVGDYGISRNMVEISGMETVVDKIKSASVSLDLSAIDEKVSKEIVEKITIHFYDKDGNEVNVSGVETSIKEVTLHMDIFQEKWISVAYAVTGTPAEGYHNRGDSANIVSVKVIAPDFTAGNKIVIPSGTFDITGADADKTFKVDLNKYLPSGYEITSSIKELEVNVDIEKYIDKTISIPVEKIMITGLNNEYQYEITTVDNRTVLYVKLSGYEDEIGNITMEDLNPSIDISNKAPGTYGIKVSLVESVEGSIASEYTVKVVVSEKITEEPTGDGGDPASISLDEDIEE